MSGIRVFSRNASVVFNEKSEFFSKKSPIVTKTFTFQENLHFDMLKRVFPVEVVSGCTFNCRASGII